MTSILYVAALLAGCDPPEPVLPGVVAELAEVGAELADALGTRLEQWNARAAELGEQTPEGLTVRAPKPYEKPAGVYVDVGHLCGRGLDSVRDVLSAQLGDILERRELNPQDGKELVLTRGSVRVKDGRIYLVKVALEGPLRRSTALQAMGLPPTVRKWNSFTHEFNTRHHAGFERIRMGRMEPGTVEVVWVEVMKTNPRR